MIATTRTSRFPLGYFVLVFVLSVPLWLFGGNKLPVRMNLPVSALTTFVPMVAAALLSYRRGGVDGLKALLKRVVDYRRIGSKTWYVPILFLAPTIYFSSFIIMRSTGRPLPEQIEIPLLLAPVVFVLYFVFDAGEELGWTAYATDPMQERWGALKAALLLGSVWALWHSVTFLQTGNPPDWVLWQCLKTVAMRIVIVWVYNNTGKSVFAAILYHTADNVSWSLFPNYSTHYDPFVTGLLTWLTVGIVAFGWGAKTLARYRYRHVAAQQ